MEKYIRELQAFIDAKEAAEQMAVMEWAAYNVGKYPCLERLYHTPNGGSRNIREAAKLKRMGVKPGVPDLFLPYPCGGHSGLWLEMKTDKGRPTQEQRDWIEYLRSVGYRAYVCHGAGEAINAIEAYISMTHEGPDERVQRLEKELVAARMDLAERNANRIAGEIARADAMNRYKAKTKDEWNAMLTAPLTEDDFI